MTESVRFPFSPDKKIIEVLNAGQFTLSAEVIPPRNGAEQGMVLGQISELIGAGAQFLSVTKGAGGSLRGGSLPIAQAVKEAFRVPCVAHFTCRDLNAAEVENQLMDHHYFGIRNILALRGDPPDGQPEWKPREGGYQYAYQLIRQIKDLNEGRYLVRASGPAVSSQIATDFCIGSAVYPEHPNPKERIEFFRLKMDAGAEYGITDMLFDADTYERFLEECARASSALGAIPVLPGTRILKSKTQAQKMMAKFRVKVPSKILDRLPENPTPESLEIGVSLFLELVEELRRRGAPGIHLFVISDTAGAATALRTLGARQRTEPSSGVQMRSALWASQMARPAAQPLEVS